MQRRQCEHGILDTGSAFASSEMEVCFNHSIQSSGASFLSDEWHGHSSKQRLK